MPARVAQVPKQARSAETSRRLLNAARELLEEQSFDETTVTGIATRAGVTIGAFYARFGDKEGIFQVLEQELKDEFDALTDDTVAPARWTASDIEAALRGQYAKLVRTYRNNRGIARALVLRSYADPVLRRRVENINKRNLPKVAMALATHLEITHPAAKRALQFAMLSVRSVCRETILFRQTWPGGKAFSDRVLVDELTRMVLGYLGVRSQ